MLLIEKLTQYILLCHQLQPKAICWASNHLSIGTGEPRRAWKSRLSASAQRTRPISIKHSATVEYKHSSGPAVTWHTPLDSWKLRGRELLPITRYRGFQCKVSWKQAVTGIIILLEGMGVIYQMYTMIRGCPCFIWDMIYGKAEHLSGMICALGMRVKSWTKWTELIPTLRMASCNSGNQILP